MQSTESQESHSSSAIKAIRTGGEVFSNGSILELVSPPGDDSLQLLLASDQQVTVAREIQFNSHRYVPLELDSSLRGAMRFPAPPVSPPSTTFPELANEIAYLFESHIGLSGSESSLITAWVFSTWFPECFWRAPELVIAGSNMDLGMMLMSLLQCLVRHPLALAGLQCATILAPFMPAHPTILLSAPGMSPRVLQLLRTSNYRNLVVPGPGGTVTHFAGSKAIFAGATTDELASFRISLPPNPGARFLSGSQCHGIASEFQTKLLSYRLRHLKSIFALQESEAASACNTQLARLQQCILDNEQFSGRVAATVAIQDEEISSMMACKPEVVLVEVLWAPAHEVGKISVKDLTALFNALRWIRGERDQYNDVEVGLMLASQGFPRRRNGSGMVLRFSSEVCQRLHDLAGQIGLQLTKFPECSMCVQVSKAVVSKATVQGM